jgi:glycine/D-amino acid oxidase-like deaminating enzyme
MTNELAQCLWWNGLAPSTGSAEPPPARVDVAIVGGGYTGLAAARALARSGATVAVLERETIGWGASSRNGGMVLPGYKAELASLVRLYGQERARVLFEDSLAAIAFVETLIRDEAIACDWRRSGHVTLAARPAHVKDLEKAQALLWRGFGYRSELLDRPALSEEIGSARYHGGLLDPLAGQVQPAQYLAGLAVVAARAGAVLVEQAEVRGIERSGPRFRLTTSRGVVDAGNVLLATNGYSGGLVPWLSRRVVPVGSYIIATERLSPELQRRLIPRGRMLSDTKNLLYYFRLSPDGRLVFGGRAAFVPTALERSRQLLQRGMIEVFPELAATRVEYAWGGTLGFTLDQMPHAGHRDGVAYALGYGGHGVALASWVGDRVGQAMGGRSPWPGVAAIPFPAVPLYWGRPWFLPLAGAYYGLKDWIM